MPDNIHRFRSLKHGDPETKLKMIPDAITPQRTWLFAIAVIVAAATGYAAVTISQTW